jgi:hypothetical protein
MWHHEQRERNARVGSDLDAHRHDGDERPGALDLGHLRRPFEPEPDQGFVHGLQLQHALAARARVRVDWTGAAARWAPLDGGTGPLGDLPVTDTVRDDVTGDLYAATDFAVLKQAAGTTTWTLAADGMPIVEVAGLTVVPSERILYAATHGRSMWRLNLD